MDRLEVRGGNVKGLDDAQSDGMAWNRPSNVMLPGPLHRTTEVLGRMTSAVEAFLDDVVWPSALERRNEEKWK